ncbi:unnamed protein product [Microthlaspi erraticum]|uniref:Glabrous enhancer-binding protein-like DBD domain-containing protein n=1 Tax=Microthlaspi erraticum TaxID=1685480 RepID=A0A6D2KUP6_9BRAS|nr:unnamed protein product [Microthlaspi erraticum]
MSTSQSLSGRKSPRKHAEEKEQTTKKRSKTNQLASSPAQSNPIWDKEDELALLKGLVDYQAKSGLQSDVDSDAFRRFIGDSITAKFSKEQIQSKIGDLKERFFTRVEKISPGEDPTFSDDEEAFGYSNKIWGQDDSDFADEQIKNVVVDNVKPSNAAAAETESATETETETESESETESSEGDNEIGDADEWLRDAFETLVSRETETESESETESSEGDNEIGDADEWLRDAFETLVSRGWSDYQKKPYLEKLMRLETRKRKELSDEWKALCSEESKWMIKKVRLTAKLVEFANFK